MRMRFSLNLILFDISGKNPILFLLLFAIVTGDVAACSHMKNGGAYSRDIAAASGFASQKALSRAFLE